MIVAAEIKFPLLKRISVRITLLILVILSTGIGLTIFYFLNSQNETIINARETAIIEESNIVYYAIKNNMLAGEAPIAVSLFQEFNKSNDIGDVKLYRHNGIIAFSDNSTLNEVNKNLNAEVFKPKITFIKKERIEDDNFKASSQKVEDKFVRSTKGKNKEVVVFKPLINQPKCAVCHGQNHVVRGVIRISSPLNDVYRQARKNLIFSILLYGIVVIVLSIAIIFFLHRFVITRIFKIGTVVNGLSRGDFKTKIDVKKGDSDEVGRLSHQINKMIDGLYERLKLTKFVSQSTLNHIKNDDDIVLGGEKSIKTVLFSDIREFTNYSESRDPNDVMRMLNAVMNVQAKIISEFGGDIDKFVGDEILAVFHGNDMEIRATKAAEKIITRMKRDFSKPGNEICVGIGINTGEMISGNMGSGQRMDRTVLGDAVNLGARLCSIAGKNIVLLSESTYQAISQDVEVKEHEAVNVKGKDKKVKIFLLRKTTCEDSSLLL